ncbi:muscle, skeletal receptor tyrosine- kinase-like [Paramuricea clavata]|uniref:Muscle, skeletal receptor tyrosine- kinase-like n=1 Tax=Paramuricea clavata TaxID=317549 RepID=A0A6S7IYL6_PARCT|nr:muscle, skeletal receptor tyrosine- kinase-like [Paramuricea clavata]
MRRVEEMVASMGLTYKPLLSMLLLCIVMGLQETQVATMHSPTGVCQHYNGICSSRLNSTEHRHINSSLGMNETERVAVRLLKAVESIYEKKKDNSCKETLKKTACFFVFPFCSAQDTKLEYCREDCNHLFEICGDGLNQIVGAGKLILDGQLSRDVFGFDECNDLKSAADTSGNTTCKHLPFLDIPRKMGESEGLSKDVIIIIAVVVPLAVFLLILCGLHHRRMSKKASLHSIHYENEKGDKAVSKDRLSNVVSMRDRIQEWKVAPSELTELVDICKSRGVLDIPVDNIDSVTDCLNIVS